MKSFIKEIYLFPIRFYRRCISPLTPPCCRFTPTCSAYAVTAIERFGIFKGTVLAAWRILRCNPFCKCGIDNVPDEFGFKMHSRCIHSENDGSSDCIKEKRQNGGDNF